MQSNIIWFTPVSERRFMTTRIVGKEFDISGTQLIAVRKVLRTGTINDEESFVVAPTVTDGLCEVTDRRLDTFWLVSGDQARVETGRVDHVPRSVVRSPGVYSQGVIGQDEVLYVYGVDGAELMITRE